MIFKDQKKGYDANLVIDWLSVNLHAKMSSNMNVDDAIGKLKYGILTKLRSNPFLVTELENDIRELRDFGIVCDIDALRKSCKKDIPGWLHKDATTLLFAP